MRNIPGILSGNMPLAKRAFQTLNVDEVLAILTTRKGELETRHAAEQAEYQDRKPAETADVSVLMAWDEEEASIQERQARELAEMQSSHDDLLAELENAGALIERHDGAYDEYLAAFNAARETAETELEPLKAEQDQIEALRDKIEDSAKKIRAELSTLGLTQTFNTRFDGWEDELLRKRYVRACQARDIDPDKAPEVPELPKRPIAPAPKKTRSLGEAFFNIWDLAMLLAGATLGSSMGAAVGGISFNSDGWSFLPIFWLMLFAGVAVAYMVGKLLFPSLVQRIVVDSVDVYAYTNTNEKSEVDTQSSLLPILGLCVPFLVFISLDFYGWFRAMTERNAAVMGDEGAILFSPIAAGLVMAAVSSLAALAKLAGARLHATEVRNDLIDEARQNAGEFANELAEYEAELERHNIAKQMLRDYEEKQRQANANAEYRFDRIAEPIRQLVAEHIKLVREDDPAHERDRDDAIDAIVGKAFETVEPFEVSLREAEANLDALNERVETVTAPLPEPAKSEEAEEPALDLDFDLFDPNHEEPGGDTGILEIPAFLRRQPGDDEQHGEE